MADLLHIENLLERYPSQVSGGQRQRIAVARAIAMESEVLLMDEPLSNLDALLRLEMRAELKRLLSEIGSTTVYVTHDQVEAMSMGDRIAVMRTGKILQLGQPLDIYQTPVDRFVGGFIGNPPMNFLAAEIYGNRRLSLGRRRRRRLGQDRRCSCGPVEGLRRQAGDPRHPGREHRGRRRGRRGRLARAPAYWWWSRLARTTC